MIRLNPVISRALESFKSKLVAEFGAGLQRLVLFGSVARGEERWDSDVDVLVLLDRVTWREEAWIIDQAADELPDKGVLLSPTVMSVQTFAELRARERRLALDIESEGIPL